MNDKEAYIQPVTPPSTDDAVVAWLAKQMGAERPFLLAYDDDGVIWGRWVNGELITAAEAAKNSDSAHVSPLLRGSTLRQAFVFGPQSEIRLFRNELGQWQACLITDSDDYIVESQLLLGTEVVNALNGFTHVRDRVQQGLDHIIPILLSHEQVAGEQQSRLRIHHFVEYDEKSGEARISLSRLADLTIGSRHSVEEIYHEIPPAARQY